MELNVNPNNTAVTALTFQDFFPAHSISYGFLNYRYIRNQLVC